MWPWSWSRRSSPVWSPASRWPGHHGGAVPPGGADHAAAVWLGDVVTVLRRHRSTDHERTLRAVRGAAVGRRTPRATLSGRPARLRRADVALVRAMSAYAAADGDRAELAHRLNEVHHRQDLLSPLGPSPWPLALTSQPGHRDQGWSSTRR